MFPQLRSFDLYRQIPKELTEATVHGSLISLCAGLVMLVLFLVELWAFISTSTETQIVVDQYVDPMLRINFNITMLDLPCEFATVDMLDVLGTNRFNVTKNIEKWQLDARGVKRVFAGRNREQSDVLHETDLDMAVLAANGLSAIPLKADQFDAWLREHPYTFVNFYAPWCVWCQKLEPVWEALAERLEKDGIAASVVKVDCVSNRQLCAAQKIQAFPTLRMFKNGEAQLPDYKLDRTVDAFTSFIKSRMEADVNFNALSDDRKKALEERTAANPKEYPGCMLAGYLLVNRVPGNFHIEARSKHHNLNAALTNLSHVVNHLSFGTPLSQRLLRRLESVPEAYTHTSTMDYNAYVNNKFHEAFHHYIKVVPTQYEVDKEHLGKNSILAYQMVEQSQNMFYEEEDVPEARFSYDISPLAVVVKKTGRQWYEFVTSMFAIIGGTFSVMSLLSMAMSVVFKPKKL